MQKPSETFERRYPDLTVEKYENFQKKKKKKKKTLAKHKSSTDVFGQQTLM